MRTLAFALALLGLAAFAGPGAAPAHAQSPGTADLITHDSPYPVPETVDRLESVLEDAGLRIFARIDHALGAASVDSALPPTQLLIFGNPQIGTPLMQAERTIGLDLPLRALVWQDSDGQVHISYTDPAALKERYGVTGQDAIFERMTGALANFVSSATAE
ncbi:MAG: DUF302 domain-containing protein [Alphaproteobacteria bacterium]|nr:DUF302 domain-containing protein [Alphaproteobacteria bacterium]